VSRKTERDAIESIRRGRLVLSATYNQSPYGYRASATQLLNVLERRHGKRCRHCGETKPVYEFSPDKRNSDGLHTYCKHCRMVYMGQSRKAA